jgi:hypothetical protein
MPKVEYNARIRVVLNVARINGVTTVCTGVRAFNKLSNLFPPGDRRKRGSTVEVACPIIETTFLLEGKVAVFLANHTISLAMYY